MREKFCIFLFLILTKKCHAKIKIALNLLNNLGCFLTQPNNQIFFNKLNLVIYYEISVKSVLVIEFEIERFRKKKLDTRKFLRVELSR